jgi:hypothetical protein
MIESYLNQTAVWKSKGAVSDTNQPTYAPDVSIPCRIEYSRKMIRNKDGQEVVSMATVFTQAVVRPDDVIVIDGYSWPVIAVAEEADLSGAILFREVSV